VDHIDPEPSQIILSVTLSYMTQIRKISPKASRKCPRVRPDKAMITPSPKGCHFLFIVMHRHNEL